MEIVHASKSPVLLAPEDIERGKVYRLFKPQGESHFPTDSYYIVGTDEHNTDEHKLAAWWLINLRTGIMLAMMRADENNYLFEHTEAHVHMGTVTP